MLIEISLFVIIYVAAGLMIRRGSADADRRRSSLGAGIPGRSGESLIDPNHAAILFRDSRGVRMIYLCSLKAFKQISKVDPARYNRS